MSDKAAALAFKEQLRLQAERDGRAIREYEAAEPAARDLLKLGEMTMQEAVAYLSANPPSPVTIVRLIEIAARTAFQDQQREHAQKRNALIRENVRAAWINRLDRQQSKAAFAQHHAARLKGKVSPQTIARRWLAGL